MAIELALHLIRIREKAQKHILSNSFYLIKTLRDLCGQQSTSQLSKALREKWQCDNKHRRYGFSLCVYNFVTSQTCCKDKTR